MRLHRRHFDPGALIARLARALPERYGAEQRRRDFRAVFFAASTPEQGRRVLWQILERARLYQAMAVPGDTHETYRRDGQRDIGLWILKALGEPPPATPPAANSPASSLFTNKGRQA